MGKMSLCMAHDPWEIIAEPCVAASLTGSCDENYDIFGLFGKVVAVGAHEDKSWCTIISATTP